MRGLAILLVIGLSLTGASARADEPFGLAPGPYAVGVRFVEQYDRSRSYRGAIDLVTGEAMTGETARPMQTLVWYPALDADAPLTLADYMRSSVTEEAFDQPSDQVDAALRGLLDYRLNETGDVEAARVRVMRPMWGSRDAPPAPGRFPAVIYSPSFGSTAYENAHLCEFLASQGYVVLAVPSMGRRSRGMTDDLSGVEVQAQDIGFLIGYAATLPNADLDRVAVVGFSWGGLANVFAAARDSRIDALVSWDGTVRYKPGLISQAPYVTPSSTALPFLSLQQGPREGDGAPADTDSFVDRMNQADQYRVTLKAMSHGDFSSYFQLFAPDTAYAAHSRAEVQAAYGWAARYTARFLDAYLRGDAEARAFLGRSADQNGVTDGAVTAVARLIEGPPATREALAAELAERGFRTAPDAYARMRTRAPDFEISEGDFNGWAYALMGRGRIDDALVLFELNTVLHPESSTAFDSLGDAQAAKGDKGRAIASYREALRLDASNGYAAQRLGEVSRD